MEPASSAVSIVAALVVPLLERTSQPYLQGLRNFESAEYDRTLEPRVAQMRLDLRMIADRLSSLFGTRAAKCGTKMTARIALWVYELLCVSTLMQVGMVLPMAYYFHRATVIGIPANALAVPLAGILMPSAVLAVALGYVWMPLAKLPALVAAWSLSMELRVRWKVSAGCALRIIGWRCRQQARCLSRRPRWGWRWHSRGGAACFFWEDSPPSPPRDYGLARSPLHRTFVAEAWN